MAELAPPALWATSHALRGRNITLGACAKPGFKAPFGNGRG